MTIKDTTATQHEPVKDRFFNPWRIPRNDADNLKALIADAINNIQNYEKYLQLRKRKRKTADQEIFEVSVAAILCNLTHHYLTRQPGGLAITRSNEILGKKSRYRPPVYNKTLPRLLDIMARPEMDFLTQEIGYESPFAPSKTTTIYPTERLVRWIDEYSVKLHDLDISDKEEVIILKRKKEDYWDEGGEAHYDDTAETIALRREVAAINQWLKDADLEFYGSNPRSNGAFVDDSDRRLRRIFTHGRFDRGGRLFGGFWQKLNTKERLEGILLDEEDPVYLDFGQMSVRILYGLNNAQPDHGDLYQVPGFEDHRTGIKKVFNALLNTAKPLSRMPQGVRQSFERDHRIGEVVSAIEKRHPLIKDSFCTDIGHEIQFIESTILIAILLKLKTSGIIGLPVHDALLVPRSAETEARQIMLDVFFKQTGVEGVVTAERGDD